MAKYHIKKDGTPGICRAKGKCPLGGEQEHFDNKEDAQTYADIKNSGKYGVLPDIPLSRRGIMVKENVEKFLEYGYRHSFTSNFETRDYISFAFERANERSEPKENSKYVVDELISYNIPKENISVEEDGMVVKVSYMTEQEQREAIRKKNRKKKSIKEGQTIKIKENMKSNSEREVLVLYGFEENGVNLFKVKFTNQPAKGYVTVIDEYGEIYRK